jgi:hypothetical protein
MIYPIGPQLGAMRHMEIIWDVARPDSSPEAKDNGKIPWLEHVIANRRVEPAGARGAVRLTRLSA